MLDDKMYINFSLILKQCLSSCSKIIFFLENFGRFLRKHFVEITAYTCAFIKNGLRYIRSLGSFKETSGISENDTKPILNWCERLDDPYHMKSRSAKLRSSWKYIRCVSTETRVKNESQYPFSCFFTLRQLNINFYALLKCSRKIFFVDTTIRGSKFWRESIVQSIFFKIYTYMSKRKTFLFLIKN